MAQILDGIFTSDTGSDANFDIGFVPTSITFREVEGTNGRQVYWSKHMEDTLDGGSQEGIAVDVDGGTYALNSDSQGITAYSSAAGGVRIPHPSGTRNKFTVVTQTSTNVIDFLAGDTRPTARTLTAVGTIYRPSTHNGYVYECTTDAAVLGAEPTWPIIEGESVTDDNSNIFITRREDIINAGFRGFSVASQTFQNDKSVVFTAILADRTLDFGDAVNL